MIGCVKDFARISLNLPKKFMYDLQTLGAISNNVGHHFSRIFRDFVQIFRDISRIFKDFSLIFRFSGILPGFSTNQNFWDCACTPSSYLTANVFWICVQGRSQRGTSGARPPI